MQKKPPRFPDGAISLSALAHAIEGWILDGEVAYHSPRTIEMHRLVGDKLLWFLRAKDCDRCGPDELRAFLHYLQHGHKEDGGRWGGAGTSQKTRATRPVGRRTVLTYHGRLITLFRWIVREGMLDRSPMEKLPTPEYQEDQVQPFEEHHLAALEAAAKRAWNSARDRAILLMLHDTGLRASEIAGLRMCDVDLHHRRARVLGKGDKSRSVTWGPTTSRAILLYLREELERGPDDPLFTSLAGRTAGQALTRSGILRVIKRLAGRTQIKGVRCSPHTFRHTYAIDFLRSGGDQFALMQTLGHLDIDMTAKYVRYARADVERQQRAHSPVEARRKKRS